MEDIQEEVHLRMDNLSKKLDQRTGETIQIAKDALKKSTTYLSKSPK